MLTTANARTSLGDNAARRRGKPNTGRKPGQSAIPRWLSHPNGSIFLPVGSHTSKCNV
jgi:hypothetical protein